MKEAMFQEPKEGNKVQCGLCSHRCLIAPGHRGICAVRENRDGTLYSLVYDRSSPATSTPSKKNHSSIFFPEAFPIP